jgi:hypothetical protein
MEQKVRWKQKGALVIDGLTETRHPGDEDYFPQKVARAMSVTGLVEILKDDEPRRITNVLEEFMVNEADVEILEDDEWDS